MTISRRTFLKGSASLAGIASVAALPAIPSVAETVESPTEGGPSYTRTKNQIVVTGRNGIVVGFVLQDNRLKGIGSVSIKGKALRNPGEFIAPEICTPYAEEMVYCELLDVKHNHDAIVISTRPYFRVTHRMEWTEHAMHPLVMPVCIAAMLVVNPAIEKSPGTTWQVVHGAWVGRCPGGLACALK